MQSKAYAITVLILICILLLPFSASAHPGDTDEKGGHVNQSTGEYHYHHGYPAHDHYDIDGDGRRDCPYDFDDKTGQNSGDSSKNNSRSQNGTNSAPDAESVSNGGGNMTWTYWVMGGLATVVFILSLALRNQSKKHKIEIQEIKESHQTELQGIATTLTAFDKDLRNTFGIEYLCNAAGAPYGDSLDDDFMPISKSFPKEPWGKYTLYTSQTKYHHPGCRYARMSTANNALEVHKRQHYYETCNVCFARIPDVTWAIKARSYINFFLKYVPDSTTAKEAHANNIKPSTYETKSANATFSKRFTK